MSDTQSDTAKNLQPVRSPEGESGVDRPQPGIALCLSGGGYRAMLFHLGSVWRLNQVGLLKRIARVSSVSGGSITAGMLGMVWKDLQFDANGVARNLEELLISPVRK